MRLVSIFCLVVGMLLPSMAQANLISNGNFVNCVSCSGQFSTKSGGSTDITDWLVTGHSVDLILNYWQVPPLGGNSVDLNGMGAGGVSQSFATVTGQQYLVSFYLAGNPDNNANDTLKTAVVSAGAASENFDFDTTSVSTGNMGWVLRSFVFAAISNTSTLAFSGLSQDTFYGAAIGNVDVSETPEPASLLLMGIALLSLFGYGAARARRQA